MKKTFLPGIIFILALICSVPVLTAAESVPAAPAGALAPEENTTPLTDEERQFRIEAYNEILAFSQTDENIIEVRLSKDSRWIFLQFSADAGAKQKDFCRKFNRYIEFLILTDDIDKTEEYFAKFGVPRDGTGGMNWQFSDEINKNNNPFKALWIWPICGLILVGIASVIFFRLRRTPVMQTAGGTNISGSALMSKKETVFSVKSNEKIPDAGLFDSILQKIDDNGK